MFRKSSNNDAYKSPTARFNKKQKTNTGECFNQLNNATNPLPDSPTGDLLRDGKVKPRDIQQRFQQKLNQERQQITKGGRALQEAQYSSVPDIDTSNPTATCNNISQKSKEDPLRSFDSDSMFGEEIPLDDIEDMLGFGQKENHEPQPLATTATHSPSASPVAFKPTAEISASASTIAPNADLDDDDDMFGDDIPLDLLDEPLPSNAEPSNTKHAQDTTSQEQLKPPNMRYNRYMVADVKKDKYLNGDQGVLAEKVVTLLDETNDFPKRARLREDWIQTHVEVGYIVHIPISADKQTCNDVIIDNAHGYLIVHPDRLISSTAIAESFFCLRKSVLQQKVKSLGDYSEALVHGNLIHRIVQNALQSNDFSLEGLMKETQRVVGSSLEELLAIGQNETTTMNILMEKAIQYIKAFGEIYVGPQPNAKATIATDIGPDVSTRLGCKNVAISRILDVEEHLWSPTYGLKGMVDVSIELAMRPSEKTLIVPLELKTGKTNRFISHRAQTMLYTLLMGDRYGIDINAGALLYCRTNSLYMIEAIRSDVRNLVIARNRLASAMQNRHALPAMVKNLHNCQHCPVNDACLLFHKSVENGDGASSGLAGWFDMKTNHLNDAATAMFRHWQQLIDYEEDDIDYIRRDIWRLPADLRELSGRCWNNMVFDPSYAGTSETVVSFRRHPESKQDLNMLTSLINVGDPIVISSTQGHINLGMGFVLRIDQNSVQISLTSPLRRTPQRGPGFDEELNQVYINNGETTTYRIDKDEMASGMTLMRRNIVNLFAREEDGGDVKRRRLIVDRVKPSFVTVPAIKMPPTLNPAQQEAVEKVLSAKDYAIILGMPGTGKTTTTAHIIKTLVERNKSVLLTAYTHTALDNVLVKVLDSGIDVLRLGNPEKVMPALRSSMPNNNPTLTTVANLEQFYNSKSVVGVTCLGIGHNLLQNRKFDYCIVDEASQITLPACIGPLRCANVFVLVGDQYQLPPLVRHDMARENGLQKSLFALLAEAHPEAIVTLQYQYRMNKDIMTISNTLIYDNKLKCASKSVAQRQLDLPHFQQALDSIHGGASCTKQSCWIEQILDPSRKVVFLDTDKMSATEERIMETVVNKAEASIVLQLAEALLLAGVPEERLAVISVYRSQLRLISQSLRGRPGVEIATIDKYQGRDKECVLVSLVRSNETGKTGELLRDWRRINVAFTRAKSKIIIIGSSTTLSTTALFGIFLELMRTNNWIYQLHLGAENEHTIQPPPSPREKRNREHKTHSPAEAILKNRPILRDVYNSSSL